MSTYSQTINELRQNNWKTLSNIKTRNIQMGDIESKKFQQQGQLYALAGKFGADLMEKWGDKIEQDNINEANVDWMLNQMEDWAGSDEANAASDNLLKMQKQQTDVSNYLGQEMRRGGAPTYAIHDAEDRTGIYATQMHKLNVSTIGQGYDAWINNQKLHNNNFFLANIDGKPVRIQINNPKKTLEQDVATRNHLRKEYLSLHKMDRYTKEFLALSTERGGSGFYAQILKADKAAYAAMVKQHDIRNSLDKQAITQLAWHRTKTSESLEHMYNALANGVDEKGKAIGHEGAHKFILEEIFRPGIQSNQTTWDDLVTIANTTVNGYKLGDRWERIYGIKEGKEGTLVREFFEAQDQIADDDNKQGLIRATTAGQNLIKAIDNNQITSDLNYTKAIKEIQNLDKGKLYNYDKIFRAWEGRKESPKLTQDAVKALKAKSESGTLISDLVESESDAVKNDPFIKDILATEKQLLGRKDVKQYLKDIKTQFQTEAGALGLRPDEFKTASAAKAYELKRDYFVQQIKDGNPAALALTNTEKWFTEKGGDNEEVREKFVDGDGNFLDNNFGLFAHDGNGNYPNIEAQIVGARKGLASPYIVQNKNKEQDAIVTDTFVKNKFGGNYKKALQAIDPETNRAAFYIREEETLFKNNVDYNTLLEQTGMATTWMMEHARRANMSLGEWMNLRQTAHSKPPLKDEFLEYLGEKDVMNLKSGMKNRLNGHTVDGMFRPEEISGNIAKNSTQLGAVSTTTYGDDNLSTAAQSIFDLPADKDGYITVTGRDLEGVKQVGSIATAVGASLSSSFYTDLQLGKEYELTEAIANIPKENIIQMWNDPEFGKNMYALTGNLYNLPLEDSLAGSELDMQNQQSIFEDLEKYWFKGNEEKEEEKSPITGDPDPEYDYDYGSNSVDTNPEADNPLLNLE